MLGAADSRMDGAGEPWGSEGWLGCIPNCWGGGVDGPREKTLSLDAMGSMSAIAEAKELALSRGRGGEGEEIGENEHGERDEEQPIRPPPRGKHASSGVSGQPRDLGANASPPMAAARSRSQPAASLLLYCACPLTIAPC